MLVSGPKSVVALFVERAKYAAALDFTGKEGEQPVIELLHFNNFRPVPAALAARSYGNERGEDQSLVDGVSSQYDWERTYWGCKWGACDTRFEVISDTEVKYDFETAWSPPGALIEFIGTLPEFKDLEIVLDYSEPGMMFKGQITLHQGEFADYEEEMTQDDLDELWPEDAEEEDSDD